jgi:hypothetical protein
MTARRRLSTDLACGTMDPWHGDACSIGPVRCATFRVAPEGMRLDPRMNLPVLVLAVIPRGRFRPTNGLAFVGRIRYSGGMDERPVHLELHRYGETPHGMLGFHLRFTRMRGDVTCRLCLRCLAAPARATCANCGRRHRTRPAYVGYESDALCAGCDRSSSTGGQP